MLIYWIILGWVILFGILSQITSKKVCIDSNLYENRVNIIMAITIFSIIIFFAGYRTSVADTGAYIRMFNQYPFMSDAKDIIMNQEAREPGFRFFSIFVKTYISENPNIWLSIIAVISGVGIMYPLYKYSCNFGISTFLFVASTQFSWMFNGMRQFLVAAIIFSCTSLILKKRTLLYIVIIVLLSTFHKSALILIPMYFIAKEEPWSKRTLIFITVIILIILFTNKFTSILDVIIQNSDYSSSIDEFKSTDDGTSLIRILVESVPIIIAFIFRNKIKYKLTPVIKLSINMSLIATGLYIISKIAKSGIMLGRLPIYFSLYNLILLPWLIKNISEDKKERRLVNYLMVVCYLFYFYYQMVIAWGGMGYGSRILNIWY
ncbi:MAG: EpsG family protein [Romboutsia sp.]